MASEYWHSIGCFEYLVTYLHPDITALVSILCAYNAAPTVSHWEALLCVLACLKGTHTLGLACSKGLGIDSALYGFADSTWGSDLSSRHS